MQKFASMNIKEKEPYRVMVLSRMRAALALSALTGMLLLSIGAYGSTQGSQVESEEVERSVPQVTGFRSAHFGISELETHKAIKRDFNIRKEKVETQRNDEDRTTNLAVTVEDIFPNSEPAQVVYIHGYQQKKLIQVNVLWGTPVTEDADPQALVTTANVLRKYFLQLGFNPENTVINTRIDESVFIVFRTIDEQGRMVLLQLISSKETAAEGEESEQESLFRPTSLLLSYIEDIEDPDTFRIEKGAF